MKLTHYTFLLCLLGMTACKKNIDLYPESNLSVATYYSNVDEVKAALTG